MSKPRSCLRCHGTREPLTDGLCITCLNFQLALEDANIETVENLLAAERILDRIENDG